MRVDKATGEILPDRDAVQITQERIAKIASQRALIKERFPDIYRVLEEHKAEGFDVTLKSIRPREGK